MGGSDTFATSLDWLLGNATCDTVNCAASDVEMSFEFEFVGYSASEQADLISNRFVKPQIQKTPHSAGFFVGNQ
jgi:hypothetical protein